MCSCDCAPLAYLAELSTNNAYSQTHIHPTPTHRHEHGNARGIKFEIDFVCPLWSRLLHSKPLQSHADAQAFASPLLVNKTKHPKFPFSEVNKSTRRVPIVRGRTQRTEQHNNSCNSCTSFFFLENVLLCKNLHFFHHLHFQTIKNKNHASCKNLNDCSGASLCLGVSADNSARAIPLENSICLAAPAKNFNSGKTESKS